MESEAQWKEVIEFSKQVHTIAVNALNKVWPDDEETMRPHLKSPEIFLSTFKYILSQRNEKTQAKKKAAQLALQRVKFTAEMVDGMMQEIEKDRLKIRQFQEETEKCCESIKLEKEEIINVSKKLEEEEAEESEVTIASRKLTQECEAELASIMPAIETALKSLDTMKPADIAVMKSMKNPPAVVKTVIAAICVMLDVQPSQRKSPQEDLRDLYWEPAKKVVLGDVNFMRKLREYDKDNIPEHVMTTLRAEFYNNPDFEPTRVARASSAAESLCRWVIAMEKYDKVSKEILKPKREALKRAQEQLGETIHEMKKNRTKLTTTEQKVLDLEEKLVETEAKKVEFVEQMDMKDIALARAKELIEGLKTESVKWTQIIEDFRASYSTMVGDSILSAGTVTYLGVVGEEVRKECLQGLAELIETSKEKTKCTPVDEFSLTRFTNDPLTLEHWREIDFPQDPLWLDNATIVITLASRQLWPLCVDPLGVINRWIKFIEKDNALEVTNPADENFIATLKECAQNGNPLLLEDVNEKLDAQLDNLLTRKIGKSSAAETLKLGEEEIPVNKKFRFYMTTRIRCLKPFYYYAPDEEQEREANFSVLNFVPPIAESLALQHALLSGVVAKEKKKLEAERLATIAKISGTKRCFIEIGDQVLCVLANPQGGRLISIEMTLGVLEAKKPLTEMQQQLNEDEEAMKKIDSSLDPFRKLTIKLAKKFCQATEDEEQALKPFDLENFIKRAL